jgi:hypothetical protein
MSPRPRRRREAAASAAPVYQLEVEEREMAGLLAAIGGGLGHQHDDVPLGSTAPVRGFTGSPAWWPT